jgi:hypothetical protein
MRTKPAFGVALFALLLPLVLVANLVAAPEKGLFELAGSEPKYTPGDFRPAPETMHTRFGTLEFPGGYPTEAPRARSSTSSTCSAPPSSTWTCTRRCRRTA